MIRQAIWPLAAIILALSAYGIGRLGGGVHIPPAMVATLPGEEASFSQEFNTRIRAQFPLGSSEDTLIDYLIAEKYMPQWRRRDAANSSVLFLNGLLCQKVISVSWRADASGVLTSVSGAYESHCL